jgi:Rrf2 family iron-sulfur cluster assembly transcriptional regulator
MRFGAKSHYALLALVDVVTHGNSEPAQLSQIAIRQNLPLPYLEQIFNRLKNKGLVASTRGQKGGYVLSIPPAELTIDRILGAIEEPLQITRCNSDPSAGGCQGASAKCTIHHLWENLESHINTYLANKTLAELCLMHLPLRCAENVA